MVRFCHPEPRRRISWQSPIRDPSLWPRMTGSPWPRKVYNAYTMSFLACEELMLDLTAAFAAFPVLATERFLLRAVTPDDVPNIFRIMSDPRVTRYFGALPMA